MLDYLKNNIFDQKINKTLKKAVKRCIRACLMFLGKGVQVNDYYLFKDIAKMEHFSNEISDKSCELESLMNLYQMLSEVYSKRPQNIFILFARYPTIINDIIYSSIRTLKSESEGSIMDEETIKNIDMVLSKALRIVFFFYQFIKNFESFKSKNLLLEPPQSQLIKKPFFLISNLIKESNVSQQVRLLKILAELLKDEIAMLSEENGAGGVNYSFYANIFELFENNLNALESTNMKDHLKKPQVSIPTPKNIEIEENEEEMMLLAIEMSMNPLIENKNEGNLSKTEEISNKNMGSNKTEASFNFEIINFDIVSDLFSFYPDFLFENEDLSDFFGFYFHLFYNTILIVSGFSLYKNSRLQNYLKLLLLNFLKVLKTKENSYLLKLCYCNLLNSFLNYLNKNKSETPVKKNGASPIGNEVNNLKTEQKGKLLSLLKHCDPEE